MRHFFFKLRFFLQLVFFPFINLTQYLNCVEFLVKLYITDVDLPFKLLILGYHNCRKIFQRPFYYTTKTYLYNFDPLKPHFYIVKLGFTGVYIIFLISAIKHLCFEQKYEKYQNFLSDLFHFLVVKFSLYLNRHVFVMIC